MKNLLIAGAALFGVLSTPTLVFAQDDAVIEDEVITPKKRKDWFVYADANLALMQFSLTDDGDEFVSDSQAAAYFRAGVKYKYIGAEVEYGVGLSDIEDGSLTIGVGSQQSVFGILRLPGNDDEFDIYLRLGYHSSDIDVAVAGIGEDTTTDRGFAAGIGGTAFLNGNFGLRADITAYNLDDPLDLTYVGGSVGGVVRF